MRHSVILPVLNGARHVREALDSALPQLSDDDEVIVIDNGSTDDTVEIVRRIGDARIRIVAEAAIGPGPARNTGLREAKGEIVSFLDHDDLWPDGRNAGLLAALEAHPDADAVYGRMHVRFDAGEEAQFMAMNGALSDKLVLGVFIFKAASLRATGPFRTTPLTGSDLDFLLRYNSAGRQVIAWEGDVLVYRRHDANITKNMRERQLGMMSSLASHLARKRTQT